MDANEALKEIMNAIEAPENYDDHFAVIQEKIKMASETVGESEWEKRYNELKEKYVARFTESNPPSQPKKENETMETEHPEDVRIEDLDLFGGTE